MLPEQNQLQEDTAENVVASLFETPPTDDDRILYIGNTEPLIEAVKQYCSTHQHPNPEGLAVELYEDRLDDLRSTYNTSNIQFLSVDFLTADLGEFEYVLGDPPSFPADQVVGEIDVETYRDSFRATKRNFDLAPLYLEHALEHLTEGGRVTMVLPKKFTTAESARPLRRYLATEYHVEELDEFTARSLTPQLIVTVVNEEPGVTRTPAGTFTLSATEDNWSRAIEGVEPPVDSDTELQTICRRIGAGIATGADDVFVVADDEPILTQIDEKWVYPVVGGKHLAAHDEVRSSLRIICPYTEDDRLATEDELGENFLQWAELHRDTLENRAGVDPQREPWYAWVQKPHLDALLRPKILTRDFADEIEFWVDKQGEYIPRRTVYYIVPEDHIDLETLFEYLSRPEVGTWLEAASSATGDRGHRIKTRDLKELPVPAFLSPDN